MRRSPPGRTWRPSASMARWVIIQFKTATLDTGEHVCPDGPDLGAQRHRAPALHDGRGRYLRPALRLRAAAHPREPDAIGVEKQFKAVTCGESIDAVTAFDFTPWGLCYQRLCPSTVISCSTTSPPTGAVDGDAYYLPNDTSLTGVWEKHGGEIATWSDETDSWVYCTPAAGTIVHCSDEDVDVIPPGGGGIRRPPHGRQRPRPISPSRTRRRRCRTRCD